MTDDTRPAAPPPGIAAFGDAVSVLAAELRLLRGDVHAAEQARKKSALVNLCLLCVLVLLLGAVVAVSIQNNHVASQIAGCTTAGGRCYEDGRKRTGDAIGQIMQVDILVAECARLYPGESGPEFDGKLERCVYDRLAIAQREQQQAQATPSPTPSGR